MLLRKLFRLPAVGFIFQYPYLIIGHFTWIISTRLTFRLGHYQRIKFGNVIIWVSPSKRQAVEKGVEFLRSCDCQTYSRLAARHIEIIPVGKQKKVVFGLAYAFALDETLIDVGDQGVALFLVQTLVLSESRPQFNNLKWKPERASLRKALDWMVDHSFDPVLTNAYRKIVEKWEQRHQLIKE